jgi:hypothetical protein
MRSCPSCGSINVRRSEMQKSDTLRQQMLLSPYRCRGCRTRFWVISRKAYGFGRAVAAAVATLALSWGAWSGVVYIASVSHDVVGAEVGPYQRIVN